MRPALMKLAAVTLFLCCMAVFISQTDSEGWLTLWFVLFIFVGLPVFIMSVMDLGKTLRESQSPSYLVMILGMLLGVPQALLGLVAIALGAAIVVWVLYNTFVERQPEYTGGFLTFGLGPALILVGWYWLRQAFARSPEAGNE